MEAKIKLQIITPIHIGNGEEYLPYDYVIEDNKIKIIDKKEFNKEILENKNLYENFLSISDNSKKVVNFFRNNAKKFIEEIYIEKNAKDYLLKKGDIRAPIHQFIKDINNTPYILGSSVKGVLRTVIANKIFKENKDELKDINKENTFIAKTFCNQGKFDAKKDFLKVLQISDLKPINYKKEVIKPLNIGQKGENPIPVILEVISYGEFEGTITINEYLLSETKHAPKNFNLNYIQDALRDYFKKIIEFEKNREWWKKLYIPGYEEFLIKIGKHSGAGAKTIEEKRKIKVRVGKKEKILKYQLSTWCDYNYNQLGWAKLSFMDDRI